MVAVEIPRRMETSMRPVTRDREDRNLKMGDSEKTAATECLEALQHVTTEGMNTTPRINENIPT